MVNNVVQIQLASLSALYGLASSSLIRITANYANNKLDIQVLCLEAATEEEVEDIRCFITELVASLYNAELDEEFIFVSDKSLGSKIADKDIKIFAVKGAEFRGRQPGTV